MLCGVVLCGVVLCGIVARHGVLCGVMGTNDASSIGFKSKNRMKKREKMSVTVMCRTSMIVCCHTLHMSRAVLKAQEAESDAMCYTSSVWSAHVRAHTAACS
jgi:hypothetical protein